MVFNKLFQSLALKIAVPIAVMVGCSVLILFFLNGQSAPSDFIVVPLLMVLLAGGIYFYLASFVGRLEQLNQTLNAISQGDLAVEVKVENDDELGKLQEGVQKTVNYMRGNAHIMDEIASGNFSVPITVNSGKDRLGQAFQNMSGNLFRLVQSHEEKDRLQSSIMKLLDEVSEVAEGNLATEAEVTADATGAIADAFNYMIVELRTIIRRVQETTNQVGSSAQLISNATSQLASGSEMQARQIVETTSAIEQMVDSIRLVSENAELSSEVAKNSLQNARTGAEATQNNINAMSRIRNQVQETAKRIKRLGERSQEISEIVKIIEDIADRTSMLALNASLQAAAAGEAGRGFVVVAEEVERLAERSTQATQEIDNLTRSIQLETKDAVTSMEETISEVVKGSSLANAAGRALIEIEQVSQNLAELINSITASSKQQANSSEVIAKSMADISKVTELVASSSKDASGSVRDLVSLADRLRASVATFRLPDNNTAAFTKPAGRNGQYLN